MRPQVQTPKLQKKKKKKNLCKLKDTIKRVKRKSLDKRSLEHRFHKDTKDTYITPVRNVSKSKRKTAI
jgi:hypothetical protein